MAPPCAERPTRYSSVCKQLKPCMLCDVCVQKAASMGPAGPHLRIKEARCTSRKGRTRKQPSRTLNATVRPSSEGATSKEANGIVCATDWQVQAVARRDRAWQHHAPNAQHNTHPYARSSNLVCCVMCVRKKLRLWGPPGATFESRKRDAHCEKAGHANSQAGRSTQQPGHAIARVSAVRQCYTLDVPELSVT